jgi:hypothetical protein
MESVRTSVTSGYLHETTRRCIPEGCHLQRVNLLVTCHPLYNGMRMHGSVLFTCSITLSLLSGPNFLHQFPEVAFRGGED